MSGDNIYAFRSALCFYIVPSALCSGPFVALSLQLFYLIVSPVIGQAFITPQLLLLRKLRSCSKDPFMRLLVLQLYV